MRKFIIICLIIALCGTAYAIQVVRIAPKTYKILTTVVSVESSATALPTTAMAGREYISVQNVGSNTIYIGDANVTADETSTGGIQLLPYSSWSENYDDSVVVYGRVASGTEKVVIEEGK